jgi:hypothetical protein
MKAIDLRVTAETLDLAQALIAQRGGGRADLLRAALDIGMLVIAASGPPAEHSATEVYGTLTGVRLAQQRKSIHQRSAQACVTIVGPVAVAHAHKQPPATVLDMQLWCRTASACW